MADFSSIREDECRREQLPQGIHLQPSRTIVLQSVLNEIKEHGRGSMYEEVCGVLVGNLCWDNGPYLRVDARIEGRHATHQSGSVTFTSETWTFIHEELAAKHPGRIIVGWYHTHPGFGIFLSNMDAFIHKNFFGFPWQPAYVFDPQAETDGFFFADGDNLVKEEVCVVPDAEPSVGNPILHGDGEERLFVPEEKPPHKITPATIVAASLALLLAIASATMFFQLCQTERVAQEAETKAQKAESKAADLKRHLEEQSATHRQEQEEWIVTKKTYEKELNGLRIQITKIQAERTDIETKNKANKAEIARLEVAKAKQEKVINDLEEKLKTHKSAERKTAEELEAARERDKALQKRIAELESVRRSLEESVKEREAIPDKASSPPLEEIAEPPAQNKPVERHPWYWHLWPF